ncbi:MAG: hypothetical protein JRM89_04020 [Nitrososphaerota archaeon]|nr:hypothetical protein [Nitrososphaerota archaeon]MDG7015141.1 hypothetical protein [Nitrososphaerota archaeon]
MQVISEVETVSLKVPSKVADLCKCLAEMSGYDIETYLLAGVRDLLIGELVELADFHPDLDLDQHTGSEEEDRARTDLEAYLVKNTGWTLVDLPDAVSVAKALGVKEFLEGPHHHVGLEE